jgi:cytochrome c oxidase subunit 3
MFLLMVAMASLFMLFAAFTSAYLVRKSSGNWLEFDLPNVFFINTGVILLSSLTLHLSYWAFKKGNATLYKLMLPITFILGCLFVYLQYMGWQDLAQMGIYLTGNASGALLIVISAIHAAHILGGLGAVALANVHAFMLPYKLTNTRKLRFELTLVYWHFVDVLWVYLLLFFWTQG